MSEFQEAVNWFYKWEGSAIDGTDLEQRLLESFNPSISETDRAQLVRQLTDEQAGSPRLAELYFQIGLRYLRLGLPETGKPYLLQASEMYSTALDLHHLTCIRWLYGTSLWQSGNKLAACLQWRQAIEDWTTYLPVLALQMTRIDNRIENTRLAMLRCIELQEWHRARRARSSVGMEKHRFFIAKYQVKLEFLEQRSGELKLTRQALGIKHNWYQERLVEMNTALMGKPEEAYLLMKDLAQAEIGRLSLGFIAQRDQIEALVVSGDLVLVKEAVDLLLAAIPSRTPLEKADSYLACGWALAAHLQDGWEEQLKKALFSYPPESPARVWARWLLGGIQWGIPNKRGEAANNWKTALSDLTHLKERAEWQNQPRSVNAYAEKLVAMQAALAVQRNRLV